MRRVGSPVRGGARRAGAIVERWCERVGGERCSSSCTWCGWCVTGAGGAQAASCDGRRASGCRAARRAGRLGARPSSAPGAEGKPWSRCRFRLTGRLLARRSGRRTEMAPRCGVGGRRPGRPDGEHVARRRGRTPEERAPARPAPTLASFASGGEPVHRSLGVASDLAVSTPETYTPGWPADRRGSFCLPRAPYRPRRMRGRSVANTAGRRAVRRAPSRSGADQGRSGARESGADEGDPWSGVRDAPRLPDHGSPSVPTAFSVPAAARLA